MESTHNLSKNLKAYRLFEKKSQVAFAKEIGVSKSTLQEIEQGKSPNLDTVYCISEHLGIPVAILLSDALPHVQMEITLYLLQSLKWFNQASTQLQTEVISFLTQASQLLTQIKNSQVITDELQ